MANDLNTTQTTIPQAIADWLDIESKAQRTSWRINATPAQAGGWRVSKSLAQAAAELRRLATELDTLKRTTSRHTEMVAALSELCDVTNDFLATPHHMIELRENARADLRTAMRKAMAVR